MRNARAIGLAVVIVALASAGGHAEIGWLTASAAQAAERELYVSVLNATGSPVTDLTGAEFVVREDGMRREVLRVRPATDPVQIAIVVDNSQAATGAVRDLRDALTGFVQRMHRANPIGLVTIGDRPTLVVDYTQDRARLAGGIDRLFAQPGSGAYALEAIIEVSRGLRKREASRAVILLITTEGPEFSERHYEMVLTPLRDSGAALHALVLGSGAEDDPLTDAARNRGIVLDRGTRETGGRRDTLLTSMALTGKLDEVATELLNQYLLVYARPPSLIPPEKTEVSATRPNLTVRATPIRTRPGT